MGKLAAVKDDKSDHQNDPLVNTQSTVFAEKKLIIVKGDKSSTPDAQGHTPYNIAQGSSGTVKIGGVLVHRDSDSRDCGAKTIASGQGTVFIG